jgi:hypothetical protein
MANCGYIISEGQDFDNVDSSTLHIALGVGVEGERSYDGSLGPTGVNNSTPLSCNEVDRDIIITQTLEGYVLPLLPTIPLHIHNIHLKCETLTSSKAYYSELHLPIYKQDHKIVRRFKRNNEEYLKIKKTVEQEVTRVLLDGKGLLNLAIYSLMESMRKDPDKYSFMIYYGSVSSITNNGSIFHNASYTVGQQLQYPSLDSFFEAYKAMLLDDAEKLYKDLVKEWVNRIITDYVSNQGVLLPPQPSK